MKFALFILSIITAATFVACESEAATRDAYDRGRAVGAVMATCSSLRQSANASSDAYWAVYPGVAIPAPNSFSFAIGAVCDGSDAICSSLDTAIDDGRESAEHPAMRALYGTNYAFYVNWMESNVDTFSRARLDLCLLGPLK